MLISDLTTDFFCTKISRRIMANIVVNIKFKVLVNLLYHEDTCNLDCISCQILKLIYIEVKHH